ncbi:MAG TPA: FAD-binding oxidoreductase [Alphaproteobacteria bacterium]|nr:FAD-binding oxidoreductase [Alphaproteobacteria bacterium]
MSDPALELLRAAVDSAGWIDDPASMMPYLHEWRGRFEGGALAVVRPNSTEGVAALVQAARRGRIQIVPQGGNTGLVGGSIAYPGERAIVLSLQRLNRVREIDPLNYTATVEAGCVLAKVQAAAEEADRLFPLSLGSEGSATIGGLISTNAGGIMTIRYGNMRELVLGIEAVLADGRIWNGLRRLRKDNTGYDLKQLFIGGEGSLGIVTAAVLKLFPRPRQIETAFVAISSPADALALLSRLRTATGDALSGFELIPRMALDFALRHVAGTVDPLADAHPWYVLTEATAGMQGDWLREALASALAEAAEAGLVRDATLADSEARRKALWFVREAIVEAQRFEGGSIKHDVSVPVGNIPELIERASKAVSAVLPGIRPIPFGHVGDGNIHFNLTQPEGADSAAYLARWEEFNRIVHAIVLSLGGSVSAEHGIGRFKRDEMRTIKTAVELDLMRRIKQALDPEDLMNPGVLLPD